MPPLPAGSLRGEPPQGGQARLRLGGALARVAWTSMISAATQMRSGSFDGLAGAMPGRELDAAFARMNT